MSARKSIVAVASMCLAASAYAGTVSAISESATVMFVFIALATIGMVAVPKKQVAPVEE